MDPVFIRVARVLDLNAVCLDEGPHEREEVGDGAPGGVFRSCSAQPLARLRFDPGFLSR